MSGAAAAWPKGALPSRPWQSLYRRPLPQGHGALRVGVADMRCAGAGGVLWHRRSALATAVVKYAVASGGAKCRSQSCHAARVAMHAEPPDRAAPAAAGLEFTGERFVPGTRGEIAHEHWHRYAFARRFVAGRRALDVACGEGYGSALLAQTAADVVGVDIDAAAVAHAAVCYGAPNVRFMAGSAAALPIRD